MKVSMDRMLIALSTALDVVEGELNGATRHHAKRVALLSLRLGSELGFPEDYKAQFAGAAVMHDNAISQYIALLRAERDPEYRSSAINVDPMHQDLLAGRNTHFKEMTARQMLGEHCVMGEKNMKILPFYDNVRGAVLYHHENADGSGPFGKIQENTPVTAQIIHLADQIDNIFHLDSLTMAEYESLINYIRENSNVLFSRDVVDAFMDVESYETLSRMRGSNVKGMLMNQMPDYSPDYDNRTIHDIGTVFARITDYKSHFTCMHSLGIARKAEIMGKYYELDETMCTKLYLAGALHDIGKLTVPNTILEKPGALTDEEFEIMKGHAQASWDILEDLRDIPDVVHWACNHHEKLDGTGYPHGINGDHLDKYDRLMSCIDIFQALTEPRPYKDGMSFDKTMEIMKQMADIGAIDKQITGDIGDCFRDKDLDN